MVYFFLPESNKNKQEKGKAKEPFDWLEFKNLLKRPDMLILFVIQFVTMFSMSNLFSTCALFLNAKYGYTASQTAYMFTFFGVSSAIIQGVLVGKLTNKYSEEKLLIFSTLCISTGLGLMPFMPNLYYLLPVITLVFLGSGIMNPCITSLVSQKANDKQTGVTLGVSQSLGSFARILGPIWGGYVFYVSGYHLPYLSGSILCFILLLFTPKLLNNSNQNKQENIEVLPSS